MASWMKHVAIVATQINLLTIKSLGLTDFVVFILNFSGVTPIKILW
jgi:hypothetical protein